LAGGVGGDAEHVDAAGGVLDYGEAVQPDLGDGLDVEEVGGQDPRCLCLEELSPGRVAAARRRIDSGFLQDRQTVAGEMLRPNLAMSAAMRR
jgi:hypothetical protein